MTALVTVEQVKKVLPTESKGMVTQEIIDKINNISTDPIFAEHYKENFIGYAHVMKTGKYKMDDYINAVKYASYKLMGDTNIKAWTKTFPDRYQECLNTNKTDKEISAYVSIYNKGKLVQAIMEQSLIPFHIFNQDARQQALAVQVELMTTARSEKVRSDAANSVLTHTKPPETSKVELDIGVKDSDAMRELRDLMANHAANQLKAIESGVSSVKEVAESRIITAEYEDVTDDSSSDDS
jgi:hypothetical protein